MKGLVSYVLITRNRRALVIEALASVQRQSWRPREIILVDNASTDGTAEAVAAALPEVQVVRSSENLGVAGGRNLGIGHARGEILVFLDDDAVLEAADATAVVCGYFAERPGLAALALRIEDYETRRVMLREFPARDLTGIDTEFETSYFVGAGYALRSEALAAVGRYDASYMFGPEEVDLGFRIIEAGMAILYTPRVVVRHRRSALERPSGRWYRYNLRGRFILALKNLPYRAAIPHLLIWNAYMFAKALTGWHLRDFWAGLAAGLRLTPSILRRRRPLRRATLRRLRRLHGRIWY